jgi:type VI secretion system protein ImpK
MNQHDSSSKFDDDTGTIIIPSPGGRRQETSDRREASFGIRGTVAVDLGKVPATGSNPFTSGAFSLLSLVPKLRRLPLHQAIHELRERLVSEIKGFESGALQQGVSQEQVKVATYFICSLIDQTVLNTPWGSHSDWGHHTLLVRFHNEAWGGETFFVILDRLLQRPVQNLHLLELAYLCLSLGFEGKYRTMDHGMRALEQLRQELYLQIQRIKGEPEHDLSLHWQGLRDLRNPLIRYVPLWVLTAVAGLLLIVIYLGFSYALNRTSDDVYDQLTAMAQETLRTTQPRSGPKVAPLIVNEPQLVERLRKLLAPEISKNMVAVLEGPILRIPNAFPSGSDRIREEFRPMLVKIAQELKDEPNRIQIIGHTDSQPIRFSARFPSNWHLSDARAREVAGLLVSAGPLGNRMDSEGHADTEPIAPNDTQDNKALNRRIDIFIR